MELPVTIVLARRYCSRWSLAVFSSLYFLWRHGALTVVFSSGFRRLTPREKRPFLGNAATGVTSIVSRSRSVSSSSITWLRLIVIWKQSNERVKKKAENNKFSTALCQLNIIGSAEALPILCVSDFCERERERERDACDVLFIPSLVRVRRPCRGLEKFFPPVLQRCYGCSFHAQEIVHTGHGMLGYFLRFSFWRERCLPKVSWKSNPAAPGLANQVWPFKSALCVPGKTLMVG